MQEGSNPLNCSCLSASLPAPLPATRTLPPLPAPVQDVKAGLDPHFVDRYEQIYRLAFPQQQEEQAE